MFRSIIGSPKVRAVFEDGDEILTAQMAASLAGRSPECIRIWCREASIGCFDGTLNRYFVSKRKLTEYILHRHGTLPHGLKQAG
jgi:hypothetical protein